LARVGYSIFVIVYRYGIWSFVDLAGWLILAVIQLHGCLSYICYFRFVDFLVWLHIFCLCDCILVVYLVIFLCFPIYKKFLHSVEVFAFFTREFNLEDVWLFPNLCPDSVMCWANFEFCGLYL
jgi:hypothetical protein